MGSQKGRIAWNKGLTKETNERVKKQSESMKGRIFTEEHKKKLSVAKKGERNSFYGKHHTKKSKKKMSESKKGRYDGKDNPFYGKHHTEKSKMQMSEIHKGKMFSEEHKRKIREALNKPETKRKMSEVHKGQISWCKGLTKETDERVKKQSETMKGKIFSKEHKRKLSESCKGQISWKKGLTKETDERIKKQSETMKGKIFSEEHKKNISKSKTGEKNPNWNPNRTEVYAPYGENFYNNELRNEKWNIQNSRDMLTGTMLDLNKTAYHHIDYDKSNDDPDNHCFLSHSNHSRITGNQKNPIKSKRYKKILQENTLALKNGQIPKNWSPLNKELFRQEKLKQLDLSSYII